MKTDLTSANDINPIIAFGFNAIAHFFGQTVEHYSEVVLHIGTTWDRPGQESEGARFWGHSGERRHVREYPQRSEVREAVMSFFKAATGLAIEKSYENS